MKIAVFSDIHGNLRALKTVLEQIKEKKVDLPYPFLQLSDLKNGVFDKACKSEEVMEYELVVIGHSHQDFVNGNVVSISASGLEGASYLLIEANEDGVSFENIIII